MKTITNLVELQKVEQIEEFPVFLALLQLHVVLLKAVKGQLGFVIYKHFQRLIEESLLGSCGR